MCIGPVCLDDHRARATADDIRRRVSSAALQRNTITACSPLSRVLCKQQQAKCLSRRLAPIPCTLSAKFDVWPTTGSLTEGTSEKCNS